MAEGTQAVDLTSRGSFAHWTAVTIRFSDQDPLGHVNNVAIAAYVEACRTMLVNRFLDKQRDPDINFALVRVEIDYLAEFCYPGTVDVGGRILKVGNRSFTSGYGVFLGEGCVAVSRCVNVFFNVARRVSVEPSAEVRTALLAAVDGKLP